MVWSKLTCVLSVALVAAFVGMPAAGSSTEPDLATLLGALNEASGDTAALVTLSCFTFTPQTSFILNGELVEFHWSDACGPFAHSVTSSGSTLDPQQDLNKPTPSFIGVCFNSNQEPAGRLINHLDPDYGLDLTYAGLVFRNVTHTDLSGKPCPLDNSILEYTSGVVPFHCIFHGQNDPPGQGMRGAIVVSLA